ncbi:MAG: maltose alpha-D-glucosyltransferase [Bacteroidota bacterium]
MNDQNLWYKDAIIYELHVKAFHDSNGDGLGDLEGLLKKLDYLSDLGITAIWLLPFYPSPLRDDGYDISDYYKINPSYGDIKTFKKVVKEAHKRDLKVITELVINHTSDQHPWFQRARKAPRGSNERDYYVWTDDPEKFKDARIIFTDYEPSNWSWDAEAQAYYWHRFFHHQPDLNFDNPNVQEEILKILDFWVGLGVDGFRLDAVPYLFERDGTNCENLPETHQFLKKLRTHVDEKYEGVMFLAEANMWPEDSASYFGDGDECHMNYHFPIMPRLFMSVKMEDRYPIIDIIDQTPEIPENCQWAIFLRNHDELTLEMVTDEERDYMYKVYTKDAQAKINLGIRHRLAPLLENNRGKIELMNTLLFSLPGTPVIYYGDEIGMGDNFYLGDRDGVRTPMQWTPDRNAGFSDANPHKLYLPLIIDSEYTYESINVETQQSNTSSLLWWMKRTIAMRKRYKAFSRGKIEFLSPSNAKVLAFVRSFEDEHILVVVNLSRFSQPTHLDLEEYQGYEPIEIFSRNRFPIIGEEEYMFTLSAYSYFWFDLKKENLIEQGTPKIPFLQVENWAEVRSTEFLQKLESEVLPSFLNNSTWYSGKLRGLQILSINHCIDLSSNGFHSALCIVEAQYDQGLPESYIITMAFLDVSDRDTIRKLNDKSILTELKMGEKSGYLVEAMSLDHFRKQLFDFLIKKKNIVQKKSELKFNSTIRRRKFDYWSSLYPTEQSNTTVNYFNNYSLKLFRKLDEETNPDIEITRFLTEQTSFKQVPKFKGAIEFSNTSNKKPKAIGMLQKYVPNQGTAWEYFMDVARNYLERIVVDVLPNNIYLSQDIEFSSKFKFSYLSEDWQTIFGHDPADRIQLFGKRTAEMHVALASNSSDGSFKPESFSLHYQRSLFSSLQSLTRSAFQLLQKNIPNLDADIQDLANSVLGRKNEVLEHFKKIYSKKIESLKIRNHGDFHLGQVLWTGKDFVIIDFEGEPLRSFSERRIKKSPVRDTSGIVRSFHYAIYSELMEGNISHSRYLELQAWCDRWFNIASKIYINSYRSSLGETNLVPMDNEEFEILSQTFQLEKAVYELYYELNNNLKNVRIPVKGILGILENKA